MAVVDFPMDWFKAAKSEDDYNEMLQKTYAQQPGQIIPIKAPQTMYPAPLPTPKHETLETDTYEITRKLAGIKELRFKQIVSTGNYLTGLTEDGIVYQWITHKHGWMRGNMREVD